MLSQKNIKALKILLWVAFIVSILFFLLATPVKSFENYLLTFLISVMYSIGYGFGNYWLDQFLDKKYSWITQTRQRTTWAVIGALLINISLTYIMNYINFVLFQKASVERFFSAEFNFINWFFINIALLVSTFLHARSFLLAMKENTQKKVIEQRLIATSANARFESLKNQLDPHFLFNSLNVLSALIEESSSLAERFTHDLSKVYRYVLDQKNKDLVTVAEEIDFAKTYAQLVKTRFEDSVFFVFDVASNVQQHFVVPLSLQLLLENAIKHNLATEKSPLRIKIYNTENNLIVENNLQLRAIPKEREGVGLKNIVQRYGLLTQQHHVYIEKSEQAFKVRIPVLTEKLNPMERLENNKNQAYERAYKRVKELKGFYGNLIAYCCVISFLAIINLMTNDDYLWFLWPAAGWGLGVAIQALNTFGISRKWEEKQIEKIMKQEKDRKF